MTVTQILIYIIYSLLDLAQLITTRYLSWLKIKTTILRILKSYKNGINKKILLLYI